MIIQQLYLIWNCKLWEHKKKILSFSASDIRGVSNDDT